MKGIIAGLMSALSSRWPNRIDETKSQLSLGNFVEGDLLERYLVTPVSYND